MASNKCTVKPTNQGIRTVVPSSHAIICVFVKYRGENGAKYTEIKIEKYNDATKSFDEMINISLGMRKGFNVVFYENKIFILGGNANGTFVKGVSDLSI